MVRETIEKMLKSLIESPESLESTLESIIAENGKDVGKEVKKLNLLKEKYENYDEVVSKLEEIENESLGEAEKLSKALKKAEEQEKQFKLMSNNLKIKELFIAANIDPTEYQDIIEGIVGEDTEKTEVLAKSIVSQLAKVKSDTEAKVKEELLAGNDPPPTGGTGGPEPSQGLLFAQLANAENGVAEGV